MPISFQCPNCGMKLKAPESAVGKSSSCPRCETQVTCPEPIYDAEVVGTAEAGAAAASASSHPIHVPTVDDRRPCPMCGEMILAAAAKCRFCGEVFDPSLKKTRRKTYAPGDDELSTGEIILSLLCSGIGCIVGIVWIIEGKPKGTKMFGLSLIMVIVWNVFRYLFQQALNR
jgi:predicted RNA-binding Zn-ribbon protein involved in translation (DUF1610 family)